MAMITLYQICFFVGVGFSAVSLLSMFGHGLHLGQGHSHGHAHSHNVVAKTAAQLNEASTPMLLRVNIAALVVFLACFGGVGLLATRFGTWIAIALAVGAGIAGSALINRFIGVFARGEKPLEAVTLTGTLANVTLPIRSGGIGEIVYTVGGTRRCSGARSSDERAIDKGSEVVIRRYEKGIAWVSALEDFPSSQSVQAPH